MKKSTVNQNEAATRPGNIIVSAGAGSGKTFTMISRIVDKLVNHNAKLEQMLIVTFTRAAAADMRFKLSERLAGLKDCGKAITDAADAMSVCNIGTLHSYCQKLIKMYFYAAEFDPSATLCDDGEAELMKRAAAEAATVSAVKAGGAELLAVYDMLSGRKDDKGFVDVVLEIVEYALSTPDKFGYLHGIKDDKEFFPLIDKAFEPRRDVLKYKVRKLIPQLLSVGLNDQAAAAAQLPDYLDGKISDVNYTKHSKTGGEDDKINEKFSALKKECRELIKDREEAENAKSRSGAPYARALCAVAEDALKRYECAKATQGKIDYSDLEHGALKVLRDPVCMEEIARGIKYVFIDEFQDVNPLQSEIAEAFKAAGAEMFVVGDVKQSIYGFRRCSPTHFINAVRGAVQIGDIRSGAVSESEVGERYVHIPLTDNFRSDKSVISFINTVFDDKMTPDFGGADYKGSDRLECGKSPTPEKVTGAEFVLINKPEKPPLPDVYSVKRSASAAQLPEPEAEFIADAVVRWIDESRKLYESAKAQYDADRAVYTELKKKFDAGLIPEPPEKPREPEPPTFGEAAVLMRSLDQSFCSALTGSFAARNIPFCFGRKSSVKTHPAAVALVDILRYIDNRHDDTALYTALRSPMGGFSDEQLAEISRAGGSLREARGEVGRCAFWQKADEYIDAYSKARQAAVPAENTVEDARETQNEQSAEMLKKFFELADDIAAASKRLDCGDTLGYITAKTDYFQYVYEHGGDARAVEALIEYAAERRCDIHGFLELYDSADFDLEITGGGDAVTITTEHSSKGLEFDLVIVANTGKQFNMKDTSQRVLIGESGVAVKIPERRSEDPVKSVPWIVENGFAPNKLRQEELRLFYVALTRAKNKLIVCGKTDVAEFDTQPLPPCGAHMPCDYMSGIKHLPPPVPMQTGELPGELPVSKSIADAVRAACESGSKRTSVPIKTCVTAIAHTAVLDEESDYTAGADILTEDEITPPDTRQYDKKGKGAKHEQAVDSRLRGTAYHRAMELVDFAEPNIAELREISENFECVDEKEIEAAAKIMRELTESATHVFKERYFIVDMPSEYVNREDDESTLVQGVIDLMAVDADGAVTLVDYKTGDPNSLVNDAYKMQLRLYAHAVEIATGGKYRVKAAYLYSFAAAKLIPVDVK